MTRNQINNVPRWRSGGNAWGKYEFVSLQPQHKVCGGQLGWMTGSAGILPAAAASALTSDTCGVRNNKKMAVGRFLDALCSCQSKLCKCVCLWVHAYLYVTLALESLLRMQRTNQDFHMQFALPGERRSNRWTLFPQRMGNRIYSKMVNTWHILACSLLSERLQVNWDGWSAVQAWKETSDFDIPGFPVYETIDAYHMSN